MAFALSPSVNVKEIDLSTIVPAVSTSIAGIAGEYAWGPCFDKKLITNQKDLIKVFGYPTNACARHWWSASNFLAYGNTLYVARAVDSLTAKNAGLIVEDTDTSLTYVMGDLEYLPNEDTVEDYTAAFAGSTELTVGSGEADTFVIGETVTGGTSAETGIVVYTNDTVLVVREASGAFTGGGETLTGSIVGAATSTAAAATNNDKLKFYAKYPGALGNDYKIAICNTTDWATGLIVSGVKFDDSFEYDPTDYAASGYFGVVILDSDNQIVEQHMVSTDETAKDFEGNSLFVETYINRNSKYVNVFNAESNTAEVQSMVATSMTGGNNGVTDTGDINQAYDLFGNAEEFDVSIIIDGGNANDSVVQQYIIDNICETRLDCVGVLCVPSSDVVGVDAGDAADNCAEYKTTTLSRASSYAAIYGNWKYQYDKFNDVYRWIPISGDAAGIYARTDDQRDAWFAPAGLNRGQIKNVVKLAFSPNRAQRDIMYKSQVNPIVNFASDGPVVFGQKTLQSKPSAFDRVDVRRLFIVLEKAISTASKYFLFEKNTAFTRQQMVGMIEPFLRTVQGRQGIYEFHVECSEINNTPDVIDRNELVCDIYVQATKTAEFISLNFIATRTGVDFNEFIGKVSF